MQAKKWKAKEEDDLFRFETKYLKKSRVLAPDAQLLAFANTGNYPHHTIAKKMTTKLPRFPCSGQPSCSLTLVDGTRVFVKVQKKRQEIRDNTNKRSLYHALGVPFQTLIRQVEDGRRQRERNKYTESKLSPTSVTAPEGRFDDQLWVDKHAPSCFSHLLSDERCNRGVMRALRAWDPFVFGRQAPKSLDTMEQTADESTKNKKQLSNDKRPEESSRVVLLSGPPGVGKSTLAHIIARHAGYRPVECNGSDERTGTSLRDRVLQAMETTLSFGEKAKPNCLILDEVDGADNAAAIQSVVDIIRAELPKRGTKSKGAHLRRPIIFICNNRYSPALKPLVPYANHFAVNAPIESRLTTRLRDILEKEKLSMIGGSTLMGQLVSSTNSDIRSCLNTLQFAAFRARSAMKKEGVVDISNELKEVLGTGLKDERCDLISVASMLFLKQKQSSQQAVNRILASSEVRGVSCQSPILLTKSTFQAFGDSSKLLDCVSINLSQVPFIDPTLDRCATVCSLLSQSDLFGNSGSARLVFVPASVHLLCRIERRVDLTFSTRVFVDKQYRRVTNTNLLQQFAEGVCLQARSSRHAATMATETIPFALAALAAGEGSSALTRNATSFDLLGEGERKSFEHHAAVLKSLGLSYVSEDNEEQGQPSAAKIVRLEPAIERFVYFSGLENVKQGIPASVCCGFDLSCLLHNSHHNFS